LKKQGKQLGTQYAAKKKQMAKVDNAIAAVIKKAIDDARKEAIRKADEDARLAAKAKADAKNSTSNPTTSTTTKPTIIKTKAAPKQPESELLNAENRELNANFVNNRGSLPWPVDNGFMLLHYGANKLESGSIIESKGISVGTQIGAPVKAIFDGTVLRITYIEDDIQLIVIQHGKYFTGYSNVVGVTVQAGQTVKRGQAIGKAAANLDGAGEVDFSIYDDRNILDPQKWLSTRIK
jgi:septal ring factor EnvC (AmiA/AmiB activator)